MLRSMYSAISGMQGFETKLDVIGNNIANVNTTGFKAGRVDFSDVLSQTMTNGSAPTAAPLKGGTNPQQVGLGVKVAAIQTLFTQGADQSTGNPLDVTIDGNGLFVVKDSAGNLHYTRQGDFSIDANGNLVLPNGMVVMAKTANGLSAITLSSPSDQNVQIAADGTVTATNAAGAQYTVGQLALATFPNYGGLLKEGDSLFTTSPNSGPATYGTPGTGNFGKLNPGTLEMSNVDLTREFTEMIVAQRGFDANSKMIGTDNAILQDIVNLKNG